MKQAMPLTEARAFIEAHFDEPVTLAQLAELSALSVSRFATAFRQQFGSSPYRYLCGLRIERAQALLLAGMPGSVVAAEVGFFDQSHFARHFKRFCGMTPSMYLKRSRARCSLQGSAGLLRGAGNGTESADQRTLASLFSQRIGLTSLYMLRIRRMRSALEQYPSLPVSASFRSPYAIIPQTKALVHRLASPRPGKV